MARKKYTFMNGEYNPKTWFWEFIKMYVKLMIMICLTFYEYDVPNKVSISYLICVYALTHYLLAYFCLDFIYLISGGILWITADLFEAI